MSGVAYDQNVAAVTRDYNIAPRVDYRTVIKVDGPLVVLDNVKFPKFFLLFSINLSIIIFFKKKTDMQKLLMFVWVMVVLKKVKF